MNDNVTTAFFDRLGGAATPPAPATSAEPPALEEYRGAVKFLANEERLYVFAHMSNGNERLVPTVFNEVLSFAPDRLAFVYPNGALLIRGSNVRELLPLLQFREIKELTPFDGARHREPAEGEVIIDDIHWHSHADLRKIANP